MPERQAAGACADAAPARSRAGMLERNDFGGDAPRPDAAADLPRPHGRVPGARRVPRLHPLPDDLGGLHGQSGPQRPHPRRAADRHRAGVRQVVAAVPARCAGSTTSAQDETLLPGDAPVPARPDGGADRQPREPGRAVGRRRPRSLLDSHRGAPRREPRARALPRRPARLPRPARHLLGPDRDGRLGRARHPVDAHRRRCRRPLRRAEERPRGAACSGMGLSFSASLFGLAGSLDRRLPRPAGRAGAEPLLHRARGLARVAAVERPPRDQTASVPAPAPAPRATSRWR